MMNLLILSFRFIFKHKWKFFSTLLLTLVFLFILFPINDLNDLVTSQISRLTKKNVFVQFETMSINPFAPKITLEKLFIEGQTFPTVTTEVLSVSPSLSSLFTKQPEGSVMAQGFLKGDVQVSVKSAANSDSGLKRSRIELQAKDLNLKNMREFANLPMPLLGKLSATSSAVVDLTFTEQPEMEMNLNILRFEMPSSSVVFGELGRVNLPTVKMSLIELKGKLQAGKFTIESGKLGTANDELFGDIKGEVNLTFTNAGSQIVPVLGGYDIDLNLKASAAFKEQAKFFLGFLDGYRTDLPDGARYKFKIKSVSANMPPQFTPLR